MNKPFDTTSSDGRTLDVATEEGRANLFKKRTEELTKPQAAGGPGRTIDQAIFDLRTSEDPKDVQLLAMMGDAPSKVRSEKLRIAKHNAGLTRLADENARATIPSREVAAAMAATNALNARTMAFNVRTTELMNQGGLTLDQAINSMRVNPTDAALLQAMNGVRTADLTRLADENARATNPSREVAAAMAATNARNARSMAFNVRITKLMSQGLTLDQAVNSMRVNPTDAALLQAMNG